MPYSRSCLPTLLLGALFFGAFAATPVSTAAEPDNGRVTLPVYGISFVPPKGEWRSNPCPLYPNIAMYRLVDAHDRILAELDIQSSETPPFERHRLDEFALAQNADVLVQTYSIDNAPTIAVRKERGDDKCGAFLMLVADHDGRSYTFLVQAAADNAPTHELIQLVKSVKWSAPQDPLLHLGQLQKVSVFADSKMDASVQLPTVFRRIPQNREKNLDVFLVTDAAGKQVAAISLRFIPATDDLPGIPQDEKLLDLRRRLLQTAQKRWDMSDFPLMDRKNILNHGVITSPTVVGSISSDAKAITAVSRYGAIFNQPGITEVETRAFGDPGETTAKWDATLLDIANSLRFGTDTTTQPAATSRPATP
ncbi:MAG: hypothetical protein ACTHN5_23905 [Phycisphaerae bacterium]